MLLQTIISQSNNSVDALPIEPATSFGAALSGNYTPVPGIIKSTVFIPTTEGVDTYNHHLQMKQYYGDDIHLIFSTHEQDEKGAGSRVRYFKSTDEGDSWSEPLILLEAQDDSTKDFETVGGRQSIACGLTSYNDELYAIISVDYIPPTATSTEATRQGIGILAVKINSNSTFGTPVWIDTPQSDFIAPTPVSGYPSYAFASQAFRSGIRESIINNLENDDMISYFATSPNDPLYARALYLGVPKAEPSVCLLPNGQYFRIFKNAFYNVGQTSTNKVNWNDLFLTNLPDSNAASRTRILKLRNNLVALVGNNQGSTRDPLFFGISATGLNYGSDNLYNIDATTYGAQFTGTNKDRGAQHPTIIELNSGKICVCYDWNKEEVYCATFNCPDLA